MGFFKYIIPHSYLKIFKSSFMILFTRTFKFFKKSSYGSLSNICPSKHTITLTSYYFKLPWKFDALITANICKFYKFFLFSKYSLSFNTFWNIWEKSVMEPSNSLSSCSVSSLSISQRLNSLKKEIFQIPRWTVKSTLQA